jgi:hypothetical protein
VEQRWHIDPREEDVSMRKLLLFPLVVAIVGTTAVGWASALSPNSSWKEIESAPDTITKAPMLQFNGEEVSVLNVCRKGDRLDAKTGEGFAAVENKAATHVSEIALDPARSGYDIEVDHVEGNGRQPREVPLFTKHFDIPACTS